MLMFASISTMIPQIIFQKFFSLSTFFPVLLMIFYYGFVKTHAFCVPKVSRDAQVRLPNECHEIDPSGFQAHSVDPRDDIWQYVYSEATLREAEVFLDTLEEWDFG